MLEVFYAGGTARRDFSAADIVAEIAGRGVRAAFAPSRAWLASRIAEEARAGDVVLVMGARDPSLTAFAREIVAAIEHRGAKDRASLRRPDAGLNKATLPTEARLRRFGPKPKPRAV
jgi:hypothetical protein